MVTYPKACAALTLDLCVSQAGSQIKPKRTYEIPSHSLREHHLADGLLRKGSRHPLELCIALRVLPEKKGFSNVGDAGFEPATSAV
jgi:hypothetical protein